jgi:hypothetical protein
MPRRATGINSTKSGNSKQSSGKGVFAGRVRYCVLDDKTEPNVFRDFGEWSSIGCIFYNRLGAPNPGNFSTDNFARPLFPSNKNFPLENELVYIIALPSSNVQSNVSATSYYYFQPINIWGSTHHNAIPDPINGEELPAAQQSDYQQTEAGAVRRVTDGGTEIDLGDTFQERLDIRNLQPYEGDIFHEGRWGQSIRFGSTVKDANIPNPWSDSGENGDPITIIRNGQTEEDQDPWIPILENINEDKSSIYLTSTQDLPIDVSSNDYSSYQTQPIGASAYNGNQIILNSGRLLFNSKTDSILFSSKESINLNSINSVNIDSPETIIASNKIMLGDKNGKEPVILGKEFLKDFQKLVAKIVTTSLALQTPIGTPAPGVPNPAVPAAAVQLQSAANTMLNKIERYKSKTAIVNK